MLGLSQLLAMITFFGKRKYFHCGIDQCTSTIHDGSNIYDVFLYYSIAQWKIKQNNSHHDLLWKPVLLPSQDIPPVSQTLSSQQRWLPLSYLFKIYDMIYCMISYEQYPCDDVLYMCETKTD